MVAHDEIAKSVATDHRARISVTGRIFNHTRLDHGHGRESDPCRRHRRTTWPEGKGATRTRFNASSFSLRRRKAVSTVLDRVLVGRPTRTSANYFNADLMLLRRNGVGLPARSHIAPSPN